MLCCMISFFAPCVSWHEAAREGVLLKWGRAEFKSLLGKVRSFFLHLTVVQLQQTVTWNIDVSATSLPVSCLVVSSFCFFFKCVTICTCVFCKYVLTHVCSHVDLPFTKWPYHGFFALVDNICSHFYRSSQRPQLPTHCSLLLRELLDNRTFR